MARIDKWLWAARFYKSRQIARDMVDGGKVHYNGKRVKPSQIVQVGAKIILRQGYEQKEIIILAISEIRGSAPDAALLYTETPESIKKREEIAVQRALTSSQLSTEKPNKKQRRDIIKFKNINET